jgi:predicted GIY-YIG superfamily endonuclease
MKADSKITTATSVYRYYDKFNILVYVGVTSQRSARNQQHNRDKPWWEFVDRQEIDHYPTRSQALAAEQALIEKFTPPFNFQHNAEALQIRPIYEQFRRLGVGDVDPCWLLQQCASKMPVDVVDLDGTFRTQFDYAPVALGLNEAVIGQPVIYMPVGRRIGTVRTIIKHGPIAKIDALIKAQCVFYRALAVVKRLAKPRPFVFEIRHVAVFDKV